MVENAGMNAASGPVALKEWASAVRALEEGLQIIVLRKGGIIEETRDFRLVSPRFYLLPTYEHQRRELLKPEFRTLVDETVAAWSPDADTVRISVFAEAVEDIELSDQEAVDRLRDYHIWTDAFAEEPLKWKRNHPLHLLLLRIYRLERPIDVPLRDSYLGCKSWVRLEDELADAPKHPVLPDGKFSEEVDKIRRALA